MHAPPRMMHQDGSDIHGSNGNNHAANNNHHNNNFASMPPQPMAGFYAPGQGSWPAPPGTMPSFPSFMAPPFGYPGVPPMSFPPPPGNGFSSGSATSAGTAPAPFGGPAFPWPPLGPPGVMPLNFPGASYPGTQMPPTSTNSNNNNTNINTNNNNNNTNPSDMSPTPTNTTTNAGPQSQTDEAENSNSSGDNNATTSGSRTNSGGGGSGRNNHHGSGNHSHSSRNSFDVSASNSAVIEQRQLIVKFLTDNTSERQFRALFEQHGPVENARIIYDRKTGHTKGFGFITYAHAADTVKALRTMGGYPLHGRQLNVALVQTERRRAFAAHEFSPE